TTHTSPLSLHDALPISGGTAVGYGSQLFNNSGCLTEAVPAGGNGFAPGSPSNCTADTKNLYEFTGGFFFKFYNGPKGRIQWGPRSEEHTSELQSLRHLV